ncbi:MAG: hypothetical protein HY936_08920 [Nitrosomonadales bacterium]|nr:hypothetical protein [Nitrosomonadales bacterium]
MDTVLGLAVMTSPLFLIIAWLPISIWLAHKLVKCFGFNPDCPLGHKTPVLNGFLMESIRDFPYFSMRCCSNEQSGFKRGAVRLVAGLFGFVLVFILPFADEIAGQVYFNHLCATEAGVKVYQTVELPAEYWDGQGKAKFFKENGDLDHPLLKNRFGEPSLTKPYPSFFRVDETHQQLADNSNRKILGEVVSFMYWGGWISRNFSPHNTAVDCKEFHGNQFWHDFYVRFFKPAPSTR